MEEQRENPLIINPKTIPAKGLELCLELSEEVIDLTSPEVKLISPFKVKLRLNLRGEAIMVTGALDCQVQLECQRCLSLFPFRVEKGFKVEYVQAGISTQTYLELKERDLNREAYSGQRLDLRDEIRTQLILALPMKCLCLPDCQGLCPGCGVNLNLEKCNCSEKS